MPHAQLEPILKHVRTLAGTQSLVAEVDGELLQRFASTRDEAAFGVLLQRHGPMVLRVCRRGVPTAQDAEDVFQATFLLLARNASSIRKRESVCSWLHGVAYRLARKLRDRETSRKAHERNAADLRPVVTAPPSAWLELEAALDAALAELPEKFRAALVLCYLEGLTQEEAAGQLGCPLGTVRSRLARARELLRQRLVQRGMALSTAALTTALVASGEEPLPRALIAATLRAATTLKALPIIGIKLIAAIFFIVVVGGVGASLLFRPAAEPATRSENLGDEPTVKERPAVQPGVPLPEGAVLRLGSTRLRHPGLSHFVFAADGKTLLSIGDDRHVRSWDPATSQQVSSVKLQGEYASARWTILAPNGQMAAGYMGEKFVIWDAESGKELKTLPAPKLPADKLEGLISFFFSTDGKTLAVLTLDSRVTLWDWKTGKSTELTFPKRKFGGDSTFHAHFSPDGKWLAAGGGSNEPLCLFDLTTGREVHRFLCHANASVFSPDSKRLLVSTMLNDKQERETVLRLFDLSNGKQTAQFAQGFPELFYSLTFSPDGKSLVCAFSDKGRVLDIATGKVLFRLPFRARKAAFTPDGQTLIALERNQFRLWNVADWKEQNPPSGEFGSQLRQAISPDGQLLASADWLDRSVSIWDLSKGRRVRDLPLKGETRYVRNLCFSSDGKTLTALQFKGFVQSWEVETGRETRATQLEDPTFTDLNHVYITELHVSQNGRRLTSLQLIAQEGSTARLVHWDLTTGKPLNTVLLSAQGRRSVWTSDGQTLAVPLKDGLTIMDASTGTARTTIPGIRSDGPYAFSPDNRLLAAAREGKDQKVEIGVWELLSGKEVGVMPLGLNERLAFVPGGRFLLSNGDEGLRLWDLAEGKQRHRWKLPETVRTMTSLTLTPDGRKAITALSDGTALVWDLSSALKTVTRAATEKELAGWWTDLAGEPRRAYSAIWHLTQTPQASIPFIRSRLKPVIDADLATAKRHIADLDSDKFQAREKAGKELEALGRGVAPAVRQALKKAPPLETRRRLEAILSRLSDMARTPDEIRQLRVIWTLEATSTADARRLLTELAEGVAEATLSEEAKAALRRREPLR